MGKRIQQKIRGYVSFAQKQAAKALREAKEKYQMLVEKLKEGVLLEDGEGFISFVNPRTAEMLGYTEEEILGKHWSHIAAEEELDKIKTESAKRPKGINSTYEASLLAKDGSPIPVIVNATPIYSKTNKFRGVLSVFTDITEQKKLQQVRERFVATTNHELRTPLTVLKGYVDYLQKNPKVLPDTRERIYATISTNIDRLMRLINAVHDFTKITHNVFTVFPQPTNLDELLKIFHDQSLLLFPNRSIIVNYHSYTNKTTIHIDEDRILQGLHNLVSNAVKNSPRGSVVEIDVVRNANEVKISVQDYGVGIPFQTFFHLFQPFSHVDTPYSAGGTGLGLYIVKNIVQAHRGNIEVLSQEHSGSCFTMTIPDRSE